MRRRWCISLLNQGSGDLHCNNTCISSSCLLQVFVPPSKPMDEPEPEFSWEDFWPARFVWLLLTLIVGWPLYLFINATGRPYDHWPVNHFDPYSPIFRCDAQIRHKVDAVFCAHNYAVVLVSGCTGQRSFCLRLARLQTAGPLSKHVSSPCVVTASGSGWRCLSATWRC